MSNPFSQITAALKSAIETHWASLDADNPAKVKPNNRWGRDDVKGGRQPADSPAVDIRPREGGLNNITATNTSGQFARTYALTVKTDDLTTDEALDQAQWELIRALAGAHVNKLGLPTLVTKVTIDSLDVTNEDPAANKNTRYWTGSVVLTVAFQVPRSEIVPA